MTADAWITLVVVVLVVVTLAREVLPPAAVVLGGTVMLLLLGVIDGAEAFAGFSNEAPIIVGSLLILARAVDVSGVLEPVMVRLFGRSSGRALLARLLFPVTGFSGFLNNTTIVAMVAPSVVAWARRTGRPASRYLMPISFAAIVGGLMTLIGTSTNLVVSGLLTDAGRAPLGFFEIGRAGLPFAVAALLLLIFVSSRLLPVRRSPSEEVGDDAREFTVEMAVQAGSELVGRSVAEGGLRNLQGVYLVELERSGRRMTPVAPETPLQAGDRLIFAGNVNRVVDLQRIPGLTSAEKHHFPEAGARPRHRFFEAVVAEGSRLAGATLKGVGFRSEYGAAVVAIHRAGERLPGKLGEATLRPGDVLLVLGQDDFRRRWRGRPDFLVIAPLDGEPPPRREKAPVVGVVLVGVLVLAGTGVMDILQLALLAAMVLVVTRVLTPVEARNAVDLNVIVVIAASFGLGNALSASGLADRIASSIISPLGTFGDIGIVLGVLIATSMLTELITNNAAAVLMFPIALATAGQAGIESHPLAIAVALGASASFLSPIGYQTNTMVYGMGGYRFGDFARIGFPLSLTLYVVAAVFIPLGWPLR